MPTVQHVASSGHQNRITDQRKSRRKARKDIKILADFISIYCRSFHSDKEQEPVSGHGSIASIFQTLDISLCTDCRSLLLHGATKRLLCPHGPKPSCKTCPAPCYAPGYRKSIKNIMRFSGRHLIMKGRLDLVFRYLL